MTQRTTYRCGHRRIAQNTSKQGQCLTCKRAAGRKWWEKEKAGLPKKTHLRGRTSTPSERTLRRRRALAREARAAVSNSPACHLYRAEKAKREGRLNPLIAAAKAELDRQLAAQLAAGKGGRPKGRKSHVPQALYPTKPNRFPNVHEDPADALINALGTYQGAA